jgi:hypothetical protein
MLIARAFNRTTIVPDRRSRSPMRIPSTPCSPCSSLQSPIRCPVRHSNVSSALSRRETAASISPTATSGSTRRARHALAQLASPTAARAVTAGHPVRAEHRARLRGHRAATLRPRARAALRVALDQEREERRQHAQPMVHRPGLAPQRPIAVAVRERRHVPRQRRAVDLVEARAGLLVNPTQEVRQSQRVSAHRDVGGEAIPYIAGWGEDGALDAIREYAQTIDTIARRIEDALEPRPQRAEDALDSEAIAA